jgi:putative ABC transport system substrate-binding protein
MKKTRRSLLFALGIGALIAPRVGIAQREGKVRRIGFLGSASASRTADRLQALRAGLRDFGYVEGRNLVIEFRWADENYQRLPALAGELARLKVEVIVAHGTPGTRAAKQATTTIPIVMATGGDPVELGFAASLARPSGNVTGSTVLSREILVKRLELLKEAVPRARRIGFLLNPTNPNSPSLTEGVKLAAKALKAEIQVLNAESPSEFEEALLAGAKQGVDAVLVSQDGVFIANANSLGAIALKRKIPLAGFTEIAEAGGLIAYGASIPEMFRRAAYFVDRILKGAKPGDLPFEQPTKFELIINMKTAKSLGLTISQDLLFRADRVIE